MATVTVQGLCADLREPLLLEVLVELPEADIAVAAADVHRPGMALMGFTGDFLPQRVQVLGETEMAFLATLEPSEQCTAVERVLALDPPVIFIAADQTVPGPVLELLRSRECPAVRSALASGGGRRPLPRKRPL